MNFVRKSCPVNSRLWSRRIEYQMIEAGFLTFPALRGLPGFAWPSRLCQWREIASIFDCDIGTGLQQRALFRTYTGFPLTTCRKQAVHLNPQQKYVNYLLQKNNQC